MREDALRILKEERLRLGALVPADAFDGAVEALRNAYAVVHPEIWQSDFATFEILGVDPPTGIALTAIDGEHDRLFRRSWQLVATDPQRLAAYNEMKRRHVGGDPEAYRAAKSAFFARLANGMDKGRTPGCFGLTGC